MDILFVNKFFFEKGGTERYYFSLARSLEERGHRVIHFSMKHPRNLPSEFSDYFVEEKSYRSSPSPWDATASAFSFIRSRQAARKIDRLIREYHPRIAHLHNIYHQISPSIIPVLSRAGVPIVMTLHDYKLVCPNYTLFDGREYCYWCRGGRFYRAVLRRCHDGSLARSSLLSLESYWQKLSGVYRAVSFFIAPSCFMRDRLVEGGIERERIVYLPNFVVPPERDAGKDQGGDHAVPSLPEKYILYFGRLSLEKGLFTLLDAVEKLEGVPLVLCGEGPLERGLRKYVSERGLGSVTFAGFVERKPLQAVISRAQVVVVPSHFPDNAPLAVLESAALGAPVVVSDRGGLPELAERLGGMVFAWDSGRDLARKIMQVWEDDALKKSMAEAGMRGVRDWFSKEAHLEKVEAIYEKALG